MNCKDKVLNIHIFNHSKKYPNKFVPEYIKWFQHSDIKTDNQFWMIGDDELENNIETRKYFSIFKLIYDFIFSRKVNKYIFHSLPSGYSLIPITILLYLKPASYYIIIWGGEVRFKKNNNLKDKVKNLIDRLFLYRMKGFITYLESDYLAARQYSKNKKAQWIKIPSCYPSNVFSGLKPKRDKIQKILIGSSALPRNNHKDIIDRLADLSLKNVEYIIPLSYGDISYANKVSNYAKSKLSNVITIFEFYDYSRYMKLLSTIDHAIFAHTGQQGMGNIINLISSGAKVFLNYNSDSYKFFINEGFEVFSLDELNHINLTPKIMHNNIEKSTEYFSANALLKGMNDFLARES